MTAVVIGGGIAGAAISRSLAQRGVAVTLLEKSPQLCSGATWHAAGLVTRFAGGSKMKKLHVQALRELNDLEDTHGPIGLNRPGSLRLIEAGNDNRMMEAEQHVAMASLYDDAELPSVMLGPSEVKALHPLVDETQIQAAIYTQKDGDVDPTTLTNTVARLAKKHGAKIKYNAEVTGIARHDNGAFTIETRDGQAYEASIVINAAGLWSKKITGMIHGNDFDFGKHPAYVIEHQYAITQEIPEIAQRGMTNRLPVLRDLKGSSYIRQERTGLLIGPYETTCKVWDEWKDGPPDTWGMELFADRMERIEDNLCAAMELVPVLGEAGFINVTNGPTIWTGDSLPRCGSTRIPGYYDFNTLTYGITHSLPLADYLSKLILDGEQPFDIAAECDPLRYGDWTNEEFVKAKVSETYAMNNAISYGAFENRDGGREYLPKTALHDALKANGAIFGFSNGGVESPAFFTEEGGATVEEMNFQRFHAHEWAPLAAAEAAHVLEHVGLSHASFSKFKLRGAGAREFLNHATTNIVPKNIGQCKLTYALTPKGKVVAEFTLCYLGGEGADEEFYIVGSRDYTWHDQRWLEDRARTFAVENGSDSGKNVEVEEISRAVDILHLAGPKSPTMLAALIGDQEAPNFLRMKPLQIGGVEVNVFNISFSGQKGFELHFDVEHGVRVYEELLAVGKGFDMKHFGGYALNSLRLQPGYHLKSDFDYCHYKEAGIDMFVSKKRKFLGRDDDFVCARQACKFTVDTDQEHEWSVPGDTPVLRSADGQRVGYITTSAAAPGGGTLARGFFDDLQYEVGSDKLHLVAYGRKWPVAHRE
jgi:dimethylglycine dehydrogenase